MSKRYFNNRWAVVDRPAPLTAVDPWAIQVYTPPPDVAGRQNAGNPPGVAAARPPPPCSVEIQELRDELRELTARIERLERRMADATTNIARILVHLGPIGPAVPAAPPQLGTGGAQNGGRFQ